MRAVVVRSLVKKFGEFAALRGISFEVEEGEIFGLVGPNGAGKTTTFRIIATLLLPTSGKVAVYGRDVVSEAHEVRKIISYLPEDAGAYRYLTGFEYLKLIAEIYFGKGRDSEEALELGIKLSGLGDRLYDKMKTYSKGMKRRVQVARALMVKPKLAILDEPTVGLDVLHARDIRDTIKDFSKTYETTVLVSSHNMREVEELCSRVALINRGRILVQGSIFDLLKDHGVPDLESLFIRLVKGD
ncbi:MAG: multidrug ABC transporter ATP-binding protein [Thermoprotei archaeon]|nr:MAG: multidrug ABC transporter ATP-binding protein [Thermoprotei archaeon]